MRIKVAQADFLYHLLKNPPIHSPGEIELEAWQQNNDEDDEDNSEGNNLHRVFGIQLDPTLLLPPLHWTRLHLKRWGGFYTLQLILKARNPRPYHGLSARLEESLRDKQRFLPVNKCGEGYVIDEEQVSATIVASKSTELVRAINLGTGGAYPRKLEESEFCEGIRELERLAENVVTCCMSRRKEIPDITVYLQA